MSGTPPVLVALMIDAAYLGSEALVHVIDEALAAERLQALIDATHAAALPPARINPVTLETILSS